MASGRRTVTTTVAVAALCFLGRSVFSRSHKRLAEIGPRGDEHRCEGSGKRWGGANRSAVRRPEHGTQRQAIGLGQGRKRRRLSFSGREIRGGSIDFNEEMTVQVFTPYQGKIIDLFAKVGDEVKKGQTLFTIDSPDLLAADSNLIGAEGVLDLTTRNLTRLKKLYETRAVAQKDLEQGISDQQTAEGALRAARDAVRIFGKTDPEIDMIIKDRKADPMLVVPSPITGRITARNAAPGLFVQPGNAPPPYSVADISTMWMLANVAESDVPAFHVGQEVKVSVLSYPGKVFEGRISTIDSMVDPNSRRLLTRSDISDPNHELRSGMFATFVIRVGDPVRSLAVPLDGVVREGDGTMTVWVTTDRRRFTQRVVKIGMQKDGFRQILEGLQPGELVATEGAVYLSNMIVIGQTGG
jgi:membrane fusion protein, heavy metal efflux system